MAAIWTIHHGGLLRTAGGVVTGLVLLVLPPAARAQTPDPALNALVKKGFLTAGEAKDAWAEAQSNAVNRATDAGMTSKWRIDKAIKDLQLFGDLRLRYEYRDADNAAGSGSDGDRYRRERFRYSARIGLKGELTGDFYYGVRVETSTNPRSPWVTFGDDSNPTPSAKNSDGLGVGQVYVGWRPADWCELVVGKMPMPLYTSPMVWDADINPEGAVEKFRTTAGPVELFAQFGQFLYRDANPDRVVFTGDTFLLAWQVGAKARFSTNLTLRVAPVLYTYTARGSAGGLDRPYTGEGQAGLNPGTGAAHNQTGINDLLIFETPAEFDFRVGGLGARLFADFAWNPAGADRAEVAAAAAGLPRAYPGEDKAYLAGIGVGNLGLVYGQSARRNTWEARAYWQHVEQYALDVNLLDSDFLEGRGNLEGLYAAFAYAFTDSILGTVRFGFARRINGNLGTGGLNPDLPGLNPINDYHLIQFDLTYRF